MPLRLPNDMNKNDIRKKTLLSAAIIGCAALGFLVPFWPLIVISILFAAVYSNAYFAVSLGLLFDLLLGAPVGAFSVLYFPFVLFGICCILLRKFALRYFLESGDLGRV